jgi:hypothetical protein
VFEKPNRSPFTFFHLRLPVQVHERLYLNAFNHGPHPVAPEEAVDALIAHDEPGTTGPGGCVCHHCSRGDPSRLPRVG